MRRAYLKQPGAVAYGIAIPDGPAQRRAGAVRGREQKSLPDAQNYVDKYLNRC